METLDIQRMPEEAGIGSPNLEIVNEFRCYADKMPQRVIFSAAKASVTRAAASRMLACHCCQRSPPTRVSASLDPPLTHCHPQHVRPENSGAAARELLSDCSVPVDFCRQGRQHGGTKNEVPKRWCENHAMKSDLVDSHLGNDIGIEHRETRRTSWVSTRPSVHGRTRSTEAA